MQGNQSQLRGWKVLEPNKHVSHQTGRNKQAILEVDGTESSMSLKGLEQPAQL